MGTSSGTRQQIFLFFQAENAKILALFISRTYASLRVNKIGG
jgi:hypothetical protein